MGTNSFTHIGAHTHTHTHIMPPPHQDPVFSKQASFGRLLPSYHMNCSVGSKIWTTLAGCRGYRYPHLPNPSKHSYFKTRVPNLQDLMPDDLRLSWCNNNRNKRNNKCNVLETSPTTLVHGKIVYPKPIPGAKNVCDCCFKGIPPGDEWLGRIINWKGDCLLKF